MDLSGKHVLVFGSGISGIGAAILLHKLGAKLTIYDGNVKLTTEDVLKKLPLEVSAEVVIGELPDSVLDETDLAVLSPGVPTDIPQTIRIKEKNIPVWGEVELAYAASRGDVLAITGTNGKTTTTTLVGEIMKYHVSRKTAPETDQVFVVGNIGTPYTEAALKTTEKTVCVAEISSFQLETIDTFYPRVAAITNITPDHLNRHHTMEEYIRVKERIHENQGSDDTLVLNYEDEVLRRFGETAHSKVVYFSSKRRLERGLWVEDGKIILNLEGEDVPVISLSELLLPGAHNHENIMTAIAMCYSYGIPLAEIQHVLRKFTAVEHRIEYVAMKKGVIYYNDSKGTNPDAAIKAVQAMDRPTIVLGGGYDKGSSYEEWIQSFADKVKKLVLIGQTKEAIAETAKRCGFNEVVLADSFEEAFACCASLAVSGDAVLLSPACASWDMFPNYETRGKKFKELVNALED